MPDKAVDKVSNSFTSGWKIKFSLERVPHNYSYMLVVEGKSED